MTIKQAIQNYNGKGKTDNKISFPTPIRINRSNGAAINIYEIYWHAAGYTLTIGNATGERAKMPFEELSSKECDYLKIQISNYK